MTKSSFSNLPPGLIKVFITDSHFHFTLSEALLLLMHPADTDTEQLAWLHYTRLASVQGKYNKCIQPTQ